jgi:hypothetical protein
MSSLPAALPAAIRRHGGRFDRVGITTFAVHLPSKRWLLWDYASSGSSGAHASTLFAHEARHEAAPPTDLASLLHHELLHFCQFLSAR